MYSAAAQQLALDQQSAGLGGFSGLAATAKHTIFPGKPRGPTNRAHPTAYRKLRIRNQFIAELLKTGKSNLPSNKANAPARRVLRDCIRFLKHPRIIPVSSGSALAPKHKSGHNKRKGEHAGVHPGRKRAKHGASHNALPTKRRTKAQGGRSKKRILVGD